MATIAINEVLSLGMTEEHTYTHYQASFEPDFSNLILDVETNKHLHKYHFTIRNEDGSIYIGNDKIYTRFRVKIGNTYRDWQSTDDFSRYPDIQKAQMENLLQLTMFLPPIDTYGIKLKSLSGIEDNKSIEVIYENLENYEPATIINRYFTLDNIEYGKKVYISDDEYDLDELTTEELDLFNNVRHNSLDIDDEDKEIDTFCGFINGKVTSDEVSYLKAFLHTDDDYDTGLNRNENGYLLPSKGGAKYENIIPDSNGNFSIMFHGFNAGDILIKAYDSNDNELSIVWYEDKVYDDVYENIRATLYVVTDTSYKISENNKLYVNYNHMFFDHRNEDIKYIELEDITDEDNPILIGRVATRNTGAIRSYIVPEDDEAYQYMWNRVFSYDQAMFILALKSYGFNKYRDDAIKAINWLISTQLDNGAFRFSTNVNGEGDKYIRNGNTSWCLFALAHVWDSELRNEIDGLEDSIDNCLDFLKSDTILEEGYRYGSIHGGHGRYDEDDNFDEDYVIPWCSTEHNLDYYQALKLLYRLNFDVSEQLDLVYRNLQNNHFNYDTKTFRQGISSNDQYDDTRALDVYSWGIYYLRDNLELKQYIYKSLENIDDKYKLDNDCLNIGYKPYSVDDGYSQAEDVIWCEGSMGVAVAYHMFNNKQKYDDILKSFIDCYKKDFINYVTEDVDAYEMKSWKAAISSSWFIVASNYEKIFNYEYYSFDTSIQKYINEMSHEERDKLRKKLNTFNII